MNQPDLNPEFSSGKKVQQGLIIDPKRILNHAIRFWYLVVISLGVALSIAFFKNRYALRIYPVAASIIIKEAEETSEGDLIYSNSPLNNYRNYLNELYIIRSYPLVQRTLEELNFGVAFYREGNVLTTETYILPFRAKVFNKDVQSPLSFHFKGIDQRRFQLAQKLDDENNMVDPRTFAYNDTIAFAGASLLFYLDSQYGLNETNMKDGFLFTYTPESQLAGAYIGRLSATWAEEGAGVVNLAINGSIPSKEITFLNGLIHEYQQFDLEKKNTVASRTMEFITDQLIGISDSLRNVERQLQRFKDKNVMTNISDEAQRLYRRMEDIESDRAELIIRSNYYKYLTDYMNKNQNLDQIILPTSVGIQDPILTPLLTKLVDLQMQIKLSTRSENPLLNDAKRQITEIRKNVLESVKNQQGTDNIRQEFFNKQLRALEGQLNNLPAAERQLVSIQRNYSLLENLYIFLLQKRAEAGISKASTTSDIAVVNPPMLAGGPITPQPQRNYIFAVAIGLGLPLAFFVMLEVLNTKVQSREDVEKVTNIPFIGGVGHKKSTNNLEVFTHPKTSIAESFRALRSNLNYFLGQREKAVIMVTSSISGEGKTFTSINLASVINLSGKKVLIIGADMRKPKLFTDFNLNNSTGLSTYLSGMSGFDEVVQKTSFENLHLVSGGPVPPNPSELLLNSKMKEFIDIAKQRYDFVIIDTPPLAIVTDAFAFSDIADHILFVVRQNYTPKDLLKTIQDFYSNGKFKHISIVLNDIYKSGLGYGYGYGYRYGYGYTYGYGYGKESKNGYGYYTE